MFVRYAAMTKEPIIAICLVNRHELASLGPLFDRAYPVQVCPAFFDQLLRAVDQADNGQAKLDAVGRAPQR